MARMETLAVKLPPISVVIPAYNEEAFIGTTVASILDSGFPCEVIVVDDGSTDRTPQILEGFGDRIRVVRHSVNRGKGAAMASGVRAATGEIIVFCDAHLLGLKQYHLLFLVLPLIQGSAKVVLGVNLSGVGLSPVLMPILTGQRAYFRRDLEPLLDEMEGLGYGVETFLFHCFPWRQTVVVVLPGLIHLPKTSFFPARVALKGYLRESVEIVKTLAYLGWASPAQLGQLKRKLGASKNQYTFRN